MNFTAGGLTAILYDCEDVRAFTRSNAMADRLVALTPDARAALHVAGRVSIPSLQIFDDRAHRRIAARVRRIEVQVLDAVEREPLLSAAVRETLRHDIRIIATTALRVWLSLGRTGPWLIRHGRTWVEIADRTTAHQMLLAELHRRWPLYRDLPRGGALDGLARVLNRAVARLIRQRRPILVTAYLYGLQHIVSSIRDRGQTCVEVRGGRGDWRSLAHPLRSVWRLLGGSGHLSLIALPNPGPQVTAAALRVFSAVTDPVTRTVIDFASSALAASAAATQSLTEEMDHMIALMCARGLIAHTLRWSDEAALGEAMGLHGLPRFLVSHGSHALDSDPFASQEQLAHARGMLMSPLADTAVAQSPHAAHTAADPVLAVGSRAVATRPIMWGYRDVAPRRQGDRKRRILHAGTYKWLLGTRPIMYETSDEYVEGLIRLVEAVAPLDDTELVIRVRPKIECSLETLHALLPRANNCVIKTEGAFLDDLAACDLLVSFSSTTIEEALHAHRPVLLWGGSYRYRHLPSRTAPPTADDRGTVYAPTEDMALGPYIDRILDAHHGRLLSDEEIAEHVHPKDSPGLDWLIDELMGGSNGCAPRKSA